jgi:hypothetical protein
MTTEIIASTIASVDNVVGYSCLAVPVHFLTSLLLLAVFSTKIKGCSMLNLRQDISKALPASLTKPHLACPP